MMAHTERCPGAGTGASKAEGDKPFVLRKVYQRATDSLGGR